MLEKWRAIPWSIWGGTTFHQGDESWKEEREEMGREVEKGGGDWGYLTRECERKKRPQNHARWRVFSLTLH